MTAIFEHTVYDAVCDVSGCTWTSEGHAEREWAAHVAVSHEKAEHPATTEGLA
jgi:hypothetical protein